MGHWNTQFTGQIVDMEMDRQGRSHLHPEPCIVYGNVPNVPLPIHSVVPAPANQCHFSFQPMPEHPGSALFYGVPQLNGLPPQHSAINLDLAVAAPSGRHNAYLEPLSVGITAGSHGCSITYMDSMRGSFERKNPEGAPGNYQYHNASAGSSSSVTHVTAMPPEPDITLTDSASFLPPGVIDPTPMVTSGVTNRPGMVVPESVLSRNTNPLAQGNYVVPPVQLPRIPWLNMCSGTNIGDINTFARTHAPPYGQTSIHGACAEAGNVNVQGYQVPSSNSSRCFLPPSLPQGHPNCHRPPSSIQGTSRYNVNFPSQVATPSHTGMNSFLDVVDPRPTFVVPVPQTRFPLYLLQHRGIVHGSSARHHANPHVRVSLTLEDELASPDDIPGYHEAGNYIDQHRDMRLDIDHMSYEELLALGEQIGNVGTGLSEEFIQKNLKLRTFTSSESSLNLRGATCPDDQINFCVICQTGYLDKEHIATLDCGHEYHRVCIKKWLVMKNSCPVCKSMALSQKAKDF